jgi:glycerol-3-phosphate dehydrogenase
MSGVDPRAALVARVREERVWDVAVIGGGATGLGVALDAALRGFSVLLAESDDFAKGTSSRATKLVHGGVRYLAQGNIALVREALTERATLLANAPHIAQPLAFVMPAYQWWERAFYGVGLKAYDALAGSRGLGDTEFLSASRTQALLPGVRAQGLSGGVKYWDGQFDDARLAVALARTAATHGALVLNHMPCTGLLREDGQVCGLLLQDAETGEAFSVRAGCVVNATGVWVDAIRDMDREPGSASRPPMVAPSQGVHLVVDREFMPTDHALLVPKTADGRVLFAVPWLGKLILGTTDTPRDDVVREPTPFAEEVAFILTEAGRYLARAPQRSDVRSVWVGLRPLVKPSGDDGSAGEDGRAAVSTKALSREHTVLVGRSGLVTVTGGKWTTYRAMAEDVLDHCFDRQLLPRRPGGATARTPLAGAPSKASHSLTRPQGEHSYGLDAALLHELPGAQHWLWATDAASGEGLSEAMVRFAVRNEMARTVEDVLARRCHLLSLDAARAAALAQPVATLIEEELGRPPGAIDVQAFEALARQYQTLPLAG